MVLGENNYDWALSFVWKILTTRYWGFQEPEYYQVAIVKKKTNIYHVKFFLRYI